MRHTHVQECSDEARKTEAQMESNLATDVKGKKKKSFCKYASDRKKTRENVGPLNKMGVVVTQDGEKADVLNAFFGSVFTSKTSLQESQVPKI